MDGQVWNYHAGAVEKAQWGCLPVLVAQVARVPSRMEAELYGIAEIPSALSISRKAQAGR